ncbi:PucR family transcriptional regulator [Nocardiopsis mangrovi]|uniref:PucR family transcriptional regulator n=1 Tax=Nocardiopsis mangrovi TaxID=1179818 RepID=A0ABV9E6N1_9ACTN
MKNLLMRLSELDTQAGDELRVIGFFDALLQNGARLDRILLETARLAECPVGVSVPALGVHQRAGHRGAMMPAGDAAPGALTHRLADGGRVWIERSGPELPLDTMLVERLGLACTIALGGGGTDPDPALVELALSASAGELERSRALHRLGIAPDRPVQVVVAAGPGAESVRPLGGRRAYLGEVWGVLVPGPPWPGDDALAGAGALVGVSSRVPAAEAARAWRMARTAVRFAGPGLMWGRVVHWDRLGSFALVAEHVPQSAISGSADVAALDRIADGASGGPLLATLDAFVASDSLRRTATRLYLHRSSVSARLARAEKELGFPLHTPEGRSRLTLALALRRLRGPAAGSAPTAPPRDPGERRLRRGT